ncbi:MAG: rRNA methyltransferase [Sphingomonas sanxanigenens]|uniref:tRNA (cytidine(34)-2'-O)-methyltransferase n=1 Tax=Sphingomonas sanxanigenens TaxID=397260 RepID=A0A2W5C3V7_9SPHN|nr:MAG: rRNA methyltransferase [Sphingomonas sanxanigenens]
MRVALYQPDIAGNVGAVLRIGACFGIPVDIIEPCGFVFSDARMKRAGMDYLAHVDMVRHADWQAFRAAQPGRLVLMSAHGSEPLYSAAFAPDDILLMGSESAGVPQDIHDAAAMRIRIPMRPGLRSLNLAVSTGIALAEALRQTGGLPE